MDFFPYCPELPIWPRIENPYRKLGWGTLCYIYFVTVSTTRLLWGYCTVKYNTFEIILEKREFSCIKKTCMHVATREFKYTLTYCLVLTTFPSSISHSFLHNLETYSYHSDVTLTSDDGRWHWVLNQMLRASFSQ